MDNHSIVFFILARVIKDEAHTSYVLEKTFECFPYLPPIGSEIQFPPLPLMDDSSRAFKVISLPRICQINGHFFWSIQISVSDSPRDEYILHSSALDGFADHGWTYRTIA